MSRLFFVVITGSAFASAHASAQVCHGAPAAADSQIAAINARFTTPDDRDSLSTGAVDALGAAVKAALKVPSPLPIPAWMATPRLTIPYVGGRYSFTIDRDGQVGHIKIERSTLSRPLDSAFVNALAALPPQSLGRQVKLTMLVALHTHTTPPVMVSVTTPDGHTYDATHPPPASMRVEPGKHYGPHEVSLDSVTVPVWPQLPTSRVVHNGAAPRGYRGSVYAYVVFDEKGRPAQIELTKPEQANMLDAVRSALDDMEVTPASLGGCPIKFMNVVPVQFGN